MTNKDDIMDMFGEILGQKQYQKHGYHCNKCDYELEQLVVKTIDNPMKKVFYCKNSRCERFGLLTVVAKKKNK